jgi:hypothetical protein
MKGLMLVLFASKSAKGVHPNFDIGSIIGDISSADFQDL